LEAEDTKFGRDFWSKQDLTDIRGLRLPFENRPPGANEFDPTSLSLNVGAEIVYGIESLAESYGASLPAFLLSCWQSQLWKLTGNPNIVIGVAADGRTSEELEGTLGLLEKHLPIPSRVEEGLRFHELLKQSEESLTEAYEWQDCFSWREVEGSRFDAQAPLFAPLCFSYEEADEEYSTLDLSFRVEKSYACTDRYKVSLNCLKTEGGLRLEFHYDKGVLKEEAVISMADQYRTLLTSAISRPEGLISELEILSERERQRILTEFNRTERAYADDWCLHTLVEQQAQRTPGALAVISEQGRITYAELDGRANQLANYLRAMGVGTEDLVGICAARSIDMVVSALGVLKSGAAYVPLDPAYPRDRLSWMIEDAGVKVLIIQQEMAEKLAAATVKQIRIDGDWEEISKQSHQRVKSGVTADNLAYVIYTSGSTGKPKAAMNIHRGVCNRQLWMQEIYRLKESDRVLQLSSFSFDFSVWELFAPLSVGAQLVLPNADGHRDSAYLVDLIAKEGVTVAHFVPPMLQVFLEEEGVSKSQSLRRVFCGGDVLHADLQNKFLSRLDAELHNQYGPTEASIDVTYWDCQRGGDEKTVPIGRPNANNQVYLLDRRLNPVAVGVAGELYIGGISVGRGYLNRPDLTADRFIPNPFSAKGGDRLYKTGDLARYWPDGVIEFLGRIDDQVKVRGFRIELGEIKATLSEHPLVREAVIVAGEDANGQTQLLGYAVLNSGGKVGGPELRNYLKDKLPDYMVPAAIMVLKQIPLTANGKIDRNALPTAIEATRDQRGASVAAKTPAEEMLAAMWEDILEVEGIGREENFFDLGGHSLLATRVISRIREVFKVELPLRSLFEKPTVAEMAAYIEETRAWQSLAPRSIERASREGKLPLSFAQQRLWFMEQMEPGSVIYNIPAGVRLIGELDVMALERTLSEITRRHETLRTT
ncbi:MAG TPA: amino acid adenylation domain-containing protein, partial [Blastocatellia bacterium]